MSTSLAPNTRVHVLGIGGAGMSALARILVAQGVQVSGSDTAEAERLPALRDLGIEISIGHATHTVESGLVDLVIRSTAVTDEDPTVKCAITTGIPVWSRADALAALVESMTVAAVAGTHGKTTTSSMLTLMLRAGDIDCTYVVGSELAATGVNAELGTSKIAVVEADESDGTFLRLHPRCAIVTNIDTDHMDRWSSMSALEEAFMEFLVGPGSGTEIAIICADDVGARRLVARLRALPAANQAPRVITYGFNTDADVRIEVLDEFADGFSFATSGLVQLPQGRTRVPGRHNVVNAVAAAIAATHLGVAGDALVAGLDRYRGARRRFELRGAERGVRVFDDYAHHPTALAATLAAAKKVAGRGRVIALCQPYRWYRTAMFVEDYATALAAADHAVLVDVYGPGEQPVAGRGSERIAQIMEGVGSSVTFCSSVANAVSHIALTAQAGDIVLTLGGEDIRGAGPRIVTALADTGHTSEGESCDDAHSSSS